VDLAVDNIARTAVMIYRPEDRLVAGLAREAK